MRIALIDKNARHVALMDRLLFAGGHLCHPFPACAPFLEWLETESCDLLIVDSQTGDLPAEELIQRAREILPGLPAIVTMTLPRESEIVSCLHAGADDCVSKPVRGPELLARVNALMRRAGVQRPPHRTHHRFGEYAFDSTHGAVHFEDEVVLLTPKEFRFAVLLFANLSRPVSRARIFETVWANPRDDKRSRTLDTHASRLRNKLRLLPERGYRLFPLYGYGYQLDRVPVEPPSEPPAVPPAPAARGRTRRVLDDTAAETL
jgi:two-component system OmpR family response regulator